MVAIHELNWEEVSSPDFANPARHAWREAVAAIAVKAHDKLPECNGRVDSAVKIVLAGDVELLADGTARIASQSNGQTVYHIVNGHCDCKDFAKAPHNFCKHRLSAAIARRAQELVKAPLDAGTNGQATPPSQPTPAQASPAVPSPTLPEAPASVNCYISIGGRQVQLTLRGTDELAVLARLAVVLAQYPVAQACTTPPGPTAAASAPAAVQDGPPPCPIHGTTLKESTKAIGTFFCPVKDKDDGKYCQARWPAKAANR